MTQNDMKTPSQLPPMPEGKPFQIGATRAIVNTHKTDGPDTVTLRLSRVIKAKPEKVYNAFLDADALTAWLPPHGFIAKIHSFEPRVGGKFRMSFHTVTKSGSHTFGGTYLELVPHSRIVHTDQFENEPMGEGEMRITIQLTAVPEGTLVEVVQEGIPPAMASGSPYGWSQSLDKLAQLVEPDL